MSGREITLTLSDNLYERLEQRALATQRSITDEALEAMALALPTIDDLPRSNVNELATLGTLDDQRLWQVSRLSLPQRAQQRLRALARLQQRQGLTATEQEELARLLERLEDVGMLRARAAALLRERGHDVSALLPHS